MVIAAHSLGVGTSWVSCELAANNVKTLETLADQARRHHRERTGWVH